MTGLSLLIQDRPGVNDVTSALSLPSEVTVQSILICAWVELTVPRQIRFDSVVISPPGWDALPASWPRQTLLLPVVIARPESLPRQEFTPPVVTSFPASGPTKTLPPPLVIFLPA